MKRYINALKRKFLRIVASQSRPIIVYYNKNFQGEKCKNIRISTSTFFDYKENLFLSDYCFIGHFNFIEASNGIDIGEGVQITNYCGITTHSSHQSIRLYGKHYDKIQNPLGYVTGSIKIGDYSFIGPHSLIMPNSKIGKGCIVAAYSYVHGNFPDFSIIGGQPAKIIGDTRINDAEILEKYPELQPYYNEWAK